MNFFSQNETACVFFLQISLIPRQNAKNMNTKNKYGQKQCFRCFEGKKNPLI